MIDRSIRRDTIRYIRGATSKGRRLLRDYPNMPLTWLNYVFIEEDEAVRAWRLSNPLHEDPLDLLIYCHLPNNVSREPTPGLRGHPYLPPGSVDRWSNERYAREILRGGNLIRITDGQMRELIPGRLMKQVNRKREITLTLYLQHYPARHQMSLAPGMDARAALRCCHTPVEREWNPPRNVYPSPSNRQAG